MEDGIVQAMVFGVLTIRNGWTIIIEGHQYGIRHARKGVDEAKTVGKTNK